MIEIGGARFGRCRARSPTRQERQEIGHAHDAIAVYVAQDTDLDRQLKTGGVDELKLYQEVLPGVELGKGARLLLLRGIDGRDDELEQPLVKRAGEILATLAQREREPVAVEVSVEEPPQMDIFAAQEQALSNDFKAIDINSLTPIEALKLLDELKAKHGL